jgi:hypothetical protein
MTKARDLANLGNKTSLDEINDAYNAGALSNRNLIINGGFDVWQRGTSFSNFNHAYSTDRWTLSAASSATVNKTSDTIYGNVCQITLGSTDTNFVQLVENLDGFMANKDMTLSFWVKSSTITSSHCVAYNGSGFTHDVAYNVSGSWTKVVLNFNTGSTYTAGTPFRLYLLRSSNTTGVIEFAQVQLEVGDTATPFERRSYGDELAKCQRYYYMLAEGLNQSLPTGSYYNTNLITTTVQFPVTMRTAPTLDSPSGSEYYGLYSTNGFDGFSNFSTTGRTQTRGITLDAHNTGASGTMGNSGPMKTNNANAYVALDAEL